MKQLVVKIQLLVMLFFLLSSCTETRPKQAKQKPNIVFIFSDDHATQAISAYGGMLAEIAPTPNLDKLANEGMLFRRSRDWLGVVIP